MKFEQSDLDHAYEQLKSRESLWKVLVGSMAGLVVGAVAFISMATLTGYVVIYFFPISVGLGVKYLGNAFSAKYRALAGAFGLVAYVISTLFLERVYLFMTLAPVAFAITYYLSKTRMTKIEKSAVWKKGLEQKNSTSSKNV